MDSKSDLLKSGWSTLLTTFFLIVTMALASKAYAGVSMLF